MTTSQTLAHIRMSIRLIEQSFNLTHMDFRYGYALGQASFAVMQGVIGQDDYKELQDEAKSVADAFKEKFNKSLDSNLSVA